MHVLVTYDIHTESNEGQNRLRKVAEVCLAYGQRVQKSVFECHLTEMQMEMFRHRLIACINEKEDSLRIYRLSLPRERYLWTYGTQHDIDFAGPLIV